MQPLPCPAPKAPDEVITLPEGVPWSPFDPADGKVYTDGSCYEGNWGLAAGAGYSAVQLDGQLNLKRAIFAPVPAGCPQTAAFAEHLPIKQTAANAEGQVVVAPDCE